jgi:hypothetical protein
MIIGAMKCGTTSLYDYISHHPQICPAITKEPEYFSENQSHGVEVEKYNDLFRFDNTIHKYTLDGSTGYTKYPLEPKVAKNIHDYGISPKFIYIIRNPFERIESHFNFMRKDEKWALDLTAEHILSTSDYFQQLEQFRHFFPVQNMLLLDFDDLKNNPHNVLKCVYDFLNLTHSYFPDSYEVKNQTEYVSSFERRIQKLKIDRFLKFCPKATKESLKSAIRKGSPAGKRVLTEAERDMVFNHLNDGMRGLNAVYGFDSSKWGF